MADSNTRTRTTDTSDIHFCPICHDPFHGDHAAFESHVNSHFTDEGPPLDQTPVLIIHPHQFQEEPAQHCHSKLFDVPNHASTAPSAHDTEDDFKIPCEAQNCNMMVHIRYMAEHMDMHFAEQIQGDHNPKRAYNSKDIPSSKRAKANSTDTPTPNPEPAKDERRTGQTTMDGFLTHSPREPRTPSSGPSSPTQSRLPFVQKPASPSTTGITGLIDKVRILLETSLAQGATEQAYLADPSVMFFQSDKSDRGWGCGYRNIQMLLSYVVGQTYATSTTSATSAAATTSNIPTILELQRQLEYAWTNGFDAQGAAQLSYKVEGTKKWIGTTEAWSVLCSLGVRCSILDFHMPSGANGTHPAMFAAVYEYFCSPNWSPLSGPLSRQVDNSRQNGKEGQGQGQIIQTAKPPLYIQHQGHSRTIVGIEILKENQGMNLLVFDPGRWLHSAIPTLRRDAVSLSHSSGSKAVVAGDKKLDAQYLLKAFRQVGSGIAKAQYQLLGISGLYNEDRHGGGSAGWPSHRSLPSPSLQLLTRYPSLSVGWTEDEHESSKSVTSTRVP
ncbi:hypothetical protein KI688_009912 [Linnemannia hyalina]|uniref:UFSP1/2/DUB catalytic domain-containing protein n=1 Tax=Linnemannia hyalina TaxID=64524 RepID=A0A9P7XYP2_9FUNG|nr:hypothetical protein KI688_009912 [Linnemannia hyalina]